VFLNHTTIERVELTILNEKIVFIAIMDDLMGNINLGTVGYLKRLDSYFLESKINQSDISKIGRKYSYFNLSLPTIFSLDYQSSFY